ncbi:hypothetical protein SY85_00635 [Flavisolibacter tropicus]|uniref:DUF3575 domain-containing protein n=2 Tax=Flavisolibacter tropicus TaxID=1492898 RepID=A0A172TQ77_9BACT|nr:hypothetical protein SY85_00635 [Flavisolibacter tropicus]
MEVVMKKTNNDNKPDPSFVWGHAASTRQNFNLCYKQTVSIIPKPVRSYLQASFWMPKHAVHILATLLLLLVAGYGMAQQVSSTDSTNEERVRKNIVRYNLSGAILFGFDKYIILGYERVIAPNRSISINLGQASLPKLVSISTDSFDTERSRERKGYNVSIDYRFYLKKENKYQAPRGVYIGPYYSFNKFTNKTEWKYKNRTANSFVNTNSDFKIHTVGFELGYQFILWKRFALDLVMIGPGLGFYDYKATFEGNIDAATKEQLLQGLEDLLTQKFPGMNYVFSDEKIDGNGVMRTNTIGYRYLIHIGYNF